MQRTGLGSNSIATARHSEKESLTSRLSRLMTIGSSESRTRSKPYNEIEAELTTRNAFRRRFLGLPPVTLEEGK